MIFADSQHSCERFHTSGRKDSSDVWMWQSSGRRFSYTAWGPGEPTGNGNIMCIVGTDAEMDFMG